MQFIEIEFTEFRDPPGAATKSSAAAEMEMLQKRLQDYRMREAALADEIGRVEAKRKIIDAPALREQHMAKLTEIDNLANTRKADLQTQEALGKALAEEIRAHPRVGSRGYQVVSDQGVVERVVFEDGSEIPEGAVYGSRVVNVSPARPDWAVKLEAQLSKR